tara:strand:- start:48 stop:950 length:903 start_codon:yes stop_codon:yes gene_type:complete
VSERPLTLHSDWLRDIINQYITVELYELGKTYNKTSTIFYAPYYNNVNSELISTQQHFIDNGYKIVYDNLWECPVIDNKKYIIQQLEFFRYYESLWYKHLEYDAYQPNRSYKHLALMPMRLKKPHRELAEIKLQPWLDDFIWSYVDKGRQLPNDGDMNDWKTQRYFNPEWYNDTCFSFVSETLVINNNNNIVWITEKTAKPIAFRHPFVILGQMGILQTVKNMGFETFENLFDESYDTDPSWTNRLDILTNNVKQFQKHPYNSITEQKIKHNHELFFDKQLVTKWIVEEIIYPILEYAES